MNKKNIVYHYSTGLYSDIRPISLQGKSKKEMFNIRHNLTKYSMDRIRIDKYLSEINFMISELGLNNISKLISKGFNNWNYDRYMYCYIVDLSKIDINYIGYYSSIEEREFADKHYDLSKSIASYKDKKSRYLEKIGLREMSFKEYTNTDISLLNYDIDSNVDYNIKYGYRTQYASYIPHAYVSVDSPIPYTSIILYAKDFTIEHLDGKSEDYDFMLNLIGNRQAINVDCLLITKTINNDIASISIVFEGVITSTLTKLHTSNSNGLKHYIKDILPKINN